MESVSPKTNTQWCVFNDVFDAFHHVSNLAALEEGRGFNFTSGTGKDTGKELLTQRFIVMLACVHPIAFPWTMLIARCNAAADELRSARRQ